MANVRCFVRFGTNNAGSLDTAASVSGNSFPIAADSPEVVRVPIGATHFAVIRDAASDGNLTVHASA